MKTLIVLFLVFAAMGCTNSHYNKADSVNLPNKCACVDEPLRNELLYGDKITISHGLIGGTDSSLTCYQTFGTPDTQWVKFTFNPNNYQEAHSVVIGYLFGFCRLNLMAQKEYVDNLKYIYSGKWAQNKSDLLINP